MIQDNTGNQNRHEDILNNKNFSTGWVKMYRSTLDHWISDDPQYYFAWSVILMAANIKEKASLWQGELVICKRGQSLYSLQTWAEKFGKGWSIQKVRTFFKKLEKSNMIKCDGLRNTTRITVCKYELYQGQQQTSNKPITIQKQTNNNPTTATKELKENKNANNKKKDFLNTDFLNK